MMIYRLTLLSNKPNTFLVPPVEATLLDIPVVLMAQKLVGPKHHIIEGHHVPPISRYLAEKTTCTCQKVPIQMLIFYS